MQKFAKIMDKPQDARHFAALGEKVKAAYQTMYKGDGVYDKGQQTASVVSLFYGLVPPAERKAVERQLLKAIAEKNDHHDTGILGAKCIYRILAEMGETDLAMTMLNQKTWPSYGYWFENGATSLYETWDKTASSLNHIMFGDISAWFYNYLAGIEADPAHPGFKRFTVHPLFMKDIDWVRAEHASPYGAIAVNWKIRGEAFVCQVTVPVNTEASVTLDSSRPKAVKLAKGNCQSRQNKDGQATFTLGSGTYTFTGPR
jgi:alpha-L-rhamnosidase